MRILVQELSERSGGQASYKMLFEAMAKEFPNDQYIIICTKESFYWSLSNLTNVQLITFDSSLLREWYRFRMEMFDIKRIAKKCKADVIWSGNNGPYFRTGIPQVLVMLNFFQVSPLSDAKYHPRSRLYLIIIRWFFRLSLRRCDAIQVEMPFVGEYIRCISGAPQWIEVIPKAVESSQDFEPRPLSTELQEIFDNNLGCSSFTFLYIATCLPHKNHKTVMAAIEILRNRGIAARLALSATEEQLQQSYDAKKVSSLIKSGHILPLGWINKEQLAAIYDASDACVMPSHLEQLSSANLEAMHWKKSQISTDLVFAHDLCGDASLYANPNDPTDWADKMQTLIENSELQNQLITNGVNRMKAFPQSWQEVARKERVFLAEVVSKHKKGQEEHSFG